LSCMRCCGIGVLGDLVGGLGLDYWLLVGVVEVCVTGLARSPYDPVPGLYPLEEGLYYIENLAAFLRFRRGIRVVAEQARLS